MHEWGITRALIGKITELAADHGGSKVVGVKVRISASAGISTEALREQFLIASAGSVADGAALQVEILDDPMSPHAGGVVIESLEFPE